MSDYMVTEQLVNAHDRAFVAVKNLTNCTDTEADELITAIVALVFETLKQYLPGEDTCN